MASTCLHRDLGRPIWQPPPQFFFAHVTPSGSNSSPTLKIWVVSTSLGRFLPLPKPRRDPEMGSSPRHARPIGCYVTVKTTMRFSEGKGLDHWFCCFMAKAPVGGAPRDPGEYSSSCRSSGCSSAARCCGHEIWIDMAIQQLPKRRVEMYRDIGYHKRHQK